MTPGKARLSAAVCFGVAAILLSIFCAENARADESTGFIDGWVWDKGCMVTYVNDAPSYGSAVREGIWALEASTGITFVEVPEGGDLRIIERSQVFISDSLVTALYDFRGNVLVTDAPHMRSSAQQRRQIVAHEGAHFLGLSHNDEPWSLMNVNDHRLKDGLSFGDVARLQTIGRANGCIS